VYLLDSNVYIRAFRELAFGRELEAFHRNQLPRIIATRARLAERSFFQDILVAASASELGAIIVTQNTADFALISRHADITFVEPWPRAPAA
jgi:predicted nucleic acid-binding protein